MYCCGYSNGNESFTGMLLSNYGPLNMLFHFFRHLIYCFSRGFCQKVHEETIPFQLNFQKSISRGSILQKIRMSNFVILKWWPFEYKVKSWKMFPFISETNISKISNISVMISHFLKNYTDESNIVGITGRRTWQQNWKQPFDCKLVYILGKTV